MPRIASLLNFIQTWSQTSANIFTIRYTFRAQQVREQIEESRFLGLGYEISFPSTLYYLIALVIL